MDFLSITGNRIDFKPDNNTDGAEKIKQARDELASIFEQKDNITSEIETKETELAQNNEQEQQQVQEITNSLSSAQSEFENAHIAFQTADSYAKSAQSNATALAVVAASLLDTIEVVVGADENGKPEYDTVPNPAKAQAEAQAQAAQAQADDLKTQAESLKQQETDAQNICMELLSALSELNEDSENDEADTELEALKEQYDEYANKVEELNQEIEQAEQEENNAEDKNTTDEYKAGLALINDDGTRTMEVQGPQGTYTVTVNNDGTRTVTYSDGTQSTVTINERTGSISNIKDKDGNTTQYDFNTQYNEHTNTASSELNKTTTHYTDGTISTTVLDEDGNYDTQKTNQKGEVVYEQNANKVEDKNIITSSLTDAKSGIKTTINENGNVVYTTEKGKEISQSEARETIYNKNKYNRADGKRDAITEKRKFVENNYGMDESGVDGVQLDTDKYRDKYRAKYGDNKDNIEEYYKEAAEDINNDIASYYSIDVNTEEGKEALAYIYETIQNNNQIDTLEKTRQDFETAESYNNYVSHALAVHSWDDSFENDYISLNKVDKIEISKIINNTTKTNSKEECEHTLKTKPDVPDTLDAPAPDTPDIPDVADTEAEVISETEPQTVTDMMQEQEKEQLSQITQNILGKPLEECTTDEQNQAYALNILMTDSYVYSQMFNTQLTNDGGIRDGWNQAKETFDILGISRSDVEEAAAKQTEMIDALIEAINGDNDKAFQEVWLEQTGVEFNIDKLKKYEEDKAIYEFAQFGMQQAATFTQMLQKNPKNPQEILDIYNQYYQDENLAKEKFSEMIKDSFATGAARDFYPGSVENVRIGDDNQLYITYPEYGEYCYGNLADLNINNGMFASRLNVKYNTKYIEEYKTNFENSTGFSCDKLGEDYANSKQEAIGKGDKYQNTVEKYCQSQQNITKKAASLIQTGGLIVTATGGIICLTTGYTGIGAGVGAGIMDVGTKISMAGMYMDNGLEAVDILTSNKSTEEKLSGLSQEAKGAVVDTAFLALGMGINTTANSFSNLATSEFMAATGLSEKALATKAVSILSEAGADFTMSIASNYITRGELDLKGEGLQQFREVLIGIARGKVCNMKADAMDSANRLLSEGKYDDAVKTLEDSGLFSNKDINNYMSKIDSAEQPDIPRSESINSKNKTTDSSEDIDVTSGENTYYNQSIESEIKTEVTEKTVNGRKQVITTETSDNKVVKKVENYDKKGNISQTRVETNEQIANGNKTTVEIFKNNKSVSKTSTETSTINGVETKVVTTANNKGTTIETTAKEGIVRTQTIEKYDNQGNFTEKTTTTNYTDGTQLSYVEHFDENDTLLYSTRKSVVKDENGSLKKLNETWDSNGELIKSEYYDDFNLEAAKTNIIQGIFPETKNMSNTEVISWTESKLSELIGAEKPADMETSAWLQSLIDDPDFKKWKAEVDTAGEQILPDPGNSVLAKKINALSDTSKAKGLAKGVIEVTTKNKSQLLSDWYIGLLTNDSLSGDNNLAMKYTLLKQVSDSVDPETAHLPKFYDEDTLNSALNDNINLTALDVKVGNDLLGLYSDRIVQQTIESLADNNFDLSSGTGWITIPKGNEKALRILSANTWCTSSATAEKYSSAGDFYTYYKNGKPVLGVRIEEKVCDFETWLEGKQIREIQGVNNDGQIPSEYFPLVLDFLTDLGFDLNDLSKTSSKGYSLSNGTSIGEADHNVANCFKYIQYSLLQNNIKSGSFSDSLTQEDLFRMAGVDLNEFSKTDDGKIIITNDKFTYDALSLVRSTGLFGKMFNNCIITDTPSYNEKTIDTISDLNDGTYQIDRTFYSGSGENTTKKGIALKLTLDSNGNVLSSVLQDSLTGEEITKTVDLNIFSDTETYYFHGDKYYKIENYQLKNVLTDEQVRRLSTNNRKY